ncbi:uncharacterized protein LOC135387056 [Ornithodoros turicata]|uniref:uncharacterized protein LOC135387056 n=1 Tax=Ornithodoros turicata TaxID=34597 RepID=UPI0031394971
MSPGNESTSSAETTTLAVQLALWATQTQIPLQHLSTLLSIPHPHHNELPLNSRTLLSTPRSTNVTSCCGGEFIYLGILNGIKRLIDNCVTYVSENLDLQINVDGLPLYRSQTICFWPILIAVVGCIPLKPFAAAIYCGKSKPNCVDTYLAPFISEMKVLMTEGFSYRNKLYTVSLHSIVCDTPARAFVKCIKGHTGYHACEKCFVRGEYFPEGRKVVYMDRGARKRTGSNFNLQEDPEHHNRPSPLLALGVDLVARVPLDSMHLVYLGVVKKIVTGFWFSSPVTKTKLSQPARQAISNGLLDLKAWVPREFNRKPRSLVDSKLWKATEWRQFLFYTGPLVLKKVLDTAVYQHFLALSSGIYILSKSCTSDEMLDIAESLLCSFVANGQSVYGKEIYVLNFHSLIHLVDDARRFGALDTFSCFPFENYLKELKQVVRSPHKPLSQVVNRITEERSFCFEHRDSAIVTFKLEHNEGPLRRDDHGAKQYKRVDLPSFSVCTVSVCDADCTVELIDGSIVVVRNILKHNGRNVILGNVFKSLGDFYVAPVSSSLLGVRITNELGDKLLCWDLESIKCKIVRFPLAKGFLVIPLLHTT